MRRCELKCAAHSKTTDTAKTVSTLFLSFPFLSFPVFFLWWTEEVLTLQLSYFTSCSNADAPRHRDEDVKETIKQQWPQSTMVEKTDTSPHL
jgi:hypothetical protein